MDFVKHMPLPIIKKSLLHREGVELQTNYLQANVLTTRLSKTHVN